MELWFSVPRVGSIMVADSSIRPSELIQQARNGEVDAVGRLLELYLQYLKILATTQLDQKLRHRVSPSDVVQETVCEAHCDFSQFRGDTEREFVAWLRQIMVHNLCMLWSDTCSRGNAT